MIKTDEELSEFSKGTLLIQEHLLREWVELLLSKEKGDEKRGGKKTEEQTRHGRANYIIHDFQKRVLLDKPQSPHTLRWLAHALNRTVNHDYQKDARETFSLLPRREGSPGDTQKAIDIATWVRFTIERGYSEAEAKKMAGDVFHRDVRQIRRQRKRAQDYAEELNPTAAWEEYFELKGRPLPSPR